MLLRVLGHGRVRVRVRQAPRTIRTSAYPRRSLMTSQRKYAHSFLQRGISRSKEQALRGTKASDIGMPPLGKMNGPRRHDAVTVSQVAFARHFMLRIWCLCTNPVLSRPHVHTSSCSDFAQVWLLL